MTSGDLAAVKNDIRQLNPEERQQPQNWVNDLSRGIHQGTEMMKTFPTPPGQDNGDAIREEIRQAKENIRLVQNGFIGVGCVVGAVGGALLGAQIGACTGPCGIAVGAAIGGITGLIAGGLLGSTLASLLKCIIDKVKKIMVNVETRFGVVVVGIGMG